MSNEQHLTDDELKYLIKTKAKIPKYCRYNKNCKIGNSCRYLHFYDLYADRLILLASYKCKPCRFLEKCIKKNCTYAHTHNEINYNNCIKINCNVQNCIYKHTNESIKEYFERLVKKEDIKSKSFYYDNLQPLNTSENSFIIPNDDSSSSESDNSITHLEEKSICSKEQQITIPSEIKNQVSISSISEMSLYNNLYEVNITHLNSNQHDKIIFFLYENMMRNYSSREQQIISSSEIKNQESSTSDISEMSLYNNLYKINITHLNSNQYDKLVVFLYNKEIRVYSSKSM